MRATGFVGLLRALLLSAVAGLCAGHEIRPAHLQLQQSERGTIHIVWTRPIRGERAVRLVPQLSNGWLAPAPDRVSRSHTQLRKEWWRDAQRDADGNPRGLLSALAGVSVAVDGLPQTITDVLVTVVDADGASQNFVLLPARPTLTFSHDEHPAAPAAAYLGLGFEHIFTGADHLAFVLGLLLLTGLTRPLFYAVTAFTVSHSVTLLLVVSGVFSLRSSVVEAAVAVSIVLLALETLRARRAPTHRTLAMRYPWLLAFAFGWVHGFAFAGALREIGFPADGLLAAVLLFNLGVELGQLVFIALVAGIAAAGVALLRRFGSRLLAPVRTAAVTVGLYAIGSFALLLVLERVPLILRAG